MIYEVYGHKVRTLRWVSFRWDSSVYKEVHLLDPTIHQQSMKLELFFLSESLSQIHGFHSHLYNTLLWFPETIGISITFHSAKFLSSSVKFSPTTSLPSTYRYYHSPASKTSISSWLTGAARVTPSSSNIRGWFSFYTSRSFACKSSQYSQRIQCHPPNS
jgi:hypothetical protein